VIDRRWLQFLDRDGSFVEFVPENKVTRKMWKKRISMMAKWNVMFDVSISSPSTMDGLWCEHPHFSSYRASIVISMSQQENGFRSWHFWRYHISLGATYRQSFIEIRDINWAHSPLSIGIRKAYGLSSTGIGIITGTPSIYELPFRKFQNTYGFPFLETQNSGFCSRKPELHPGFPF
jgi:hypothetical protein